MHIHFALRPCWNACAIAGPEGILDGKTARSSPEFIEAMDEPGNHSKRERSFGDGTLLAREIGVSRKKVFFLFLFLIQTSWTRSFIMLISVSAYSQA